VGLDFIGWVMIACMRSDGVPDIVVWPSCIGSGAGWQPAPAKMASPQSAASLALSVLMPLRLRIAIGGALRKPLADPTKPFSKPSIKKRNTLFRKRTL
jgi:hypothetical protein